MSNLKLKLKRIDPVKAGLIYGITLACVGFIVIGIAMLFGGLLGGASGDLGVLGGLLGGGIIGLIIVPVFYFAIGFIIGWIGTSVLNFVLKKTNGLDVDFEGNGTDISMIGKE